jgi:hypothetical protein
MIKKNVGSQIDNLILDHTSLWIRGSNDLQLGHEIHHWKDLFEGYKKFPSHVKNKLDLRKI